MGRDTQQKIIARYPKLFRNVTWNIVPKRPCTMNRIRCGDGWDNIIEELCEKIDCVAKRDNLRDLQFMQIKEKFGLLRVYMNGQSSDEIKGFILEAEKKSSNTCEDCGGGGIIRKGRWLRCNCIDCDKKRKH